jgi:hypothetical protein
MAENIVGNSYMYLSLEEDSRLLMLSSPQFDAIYFELLLCLSMPYLPERIGAISSNIRQVKTMLGEGVFSHLVCTPTVLLFIAASSSQVSSRINERRRKIIKHTIRVCFEFYAR